MPIEINEIRIRAIIDEPQSQSDTTRTITKEKELIDVANIIDMAVEAVLERLKQIKED